LKHLFDDPTDKRKLHLSATPTLGGMAIFGGIFLAFTLSGYALVDWFPYLAAGLLILFFSGLKDDILVISPLKKLLFQITAVVILMGGSDLVITNLGGMFGFRQIPLTAGVPLTVFAMIVILNAYNLIDGIDGLAGGIGVIASSLFGWWFFEAGMMSHAVLSFAITGALLAFLRYNFQPASIFMGDTGSQIVGYLLGFLALSKVQHGLAAGAGSVPFQEIMPVLVLSTLIVPLYDTLRVFIARLVNGQSPFKADRRHVHHQLLDMGLSHRASCYVIYTFNIAIVSLVMGLSSWVVDINNLFGIMLLTTVVMFPTFRLKRKILSMVGVEMPSAQRIKFIERKFGVSPKSTNGTPAKAEEEEESYQELAV
jgi:UDP-N-acetylmuramyl pentapeptide phosphotransferase/UDP-N-acetylglucosamine-1-phosphate transferase